MNRLIVVGSPRTDGRSAALAELLFESCIEEFPDEEVALAPVSTLSIQGCINCGACEDLVAWRSADPDEKPDAEVLRRCSLDDDMVDVYPLLDAADELVIVAPVFFAGPSAQLKMLLDRLQPYYFKRMEEAADQRAPQRAAVLHVIGEGGDPHGYAPLVGIVRSAIACAGFTLQTVFDWVGKIDADGEIMEEADVFEADDFLLPVVDDCAIDDGVIDDGSFWDEAANAAAVKIAAEMRAEAKREESRPSLDMHSSDNQLRHAPSGGRGKPQPARGKNANRTNEGKGSKKPGAGQGPKRQQGQKQTAAASGKQTSSAARGASGKQGAKGGSGKKGGGNGKRR